MFAIYLHTSAPSITLIDSGELVLAAKVLGNPHSPGYPVYTLFAHLATWLPLGNAFFRVGLFSAACGALASVILTLLLWGLWGSYAAAATGGLLFAFSQTFWEQAVMPEVYCSAMVIQILLLWIVLADRWELPRKGREPLRFPRSPVQRLALGGFLTGIGMGLHQFILFAFPSFAILAWFYARPLLTTWRGWFAGIGFFALGFSTNLYLPLRTAHGAWYAWEWPGTLSAFRGVISTRTFHGQRWVRSWEQFHQFFGNFQETLLAQFTPSILLLAVAGAGVLLFKDRVLAGALLLWWLIDSALGVTYFNLTPRWFETLHVFFIPGHAILAMYITAALAALHRWVPGKARIAGGLIAAAFLLLPLMPLQANWAFNNERSAWFVFDWGKQVLDPLPPRAVLLMNSDEGYVLWCLQAMGRYRTDVAVIYYQFLEEPESWVGNLVQRQYPWLRIPRGSVPEMVAGFLEQGPVFSTFSDARFLPLPFRFTPLGTPAYRVSLGREKFDGRMAAIRSLRAPWRHLPLGPRWENTPEQEYFHSLLGGINAALMEAFAAGQVPESRAMALQLLALNPSLKMPRNILEQLDR